MKRYLVGLGNWMMGDDSVGLRVVEEIEKRGFATEFETVLLPDSGIHLIDYFTPETGKIVLVDAVRGGKKPGESFVLTPGDVESRKDLSNFSTHEGDILKVIEFARQLGLPIPEIVILGIEPERVEQGEMSELLADRLDLYIETARTLFIFRAA